MSLLMDALRRAEQEKQRRAGVAGARASDTAGTDTDATVAAAPTETGDDDGAEATAAPARLAGPDDVTVQIEPAAVSRASDDFERALRAFEEADGADFDLADAGDDSATFTVGEVVAKDIAQADAAAESTAGSASDVAGQTPPDTAGGLALEPLEAAPGTADDRADGAAGASSEAATPATSATTGTFGSTQPGTRRRFDHTGTMPSARALDNDLGDYFDRSQSREMPRPAAGSGLADGGVPDHTLEDVAAHTVVGAHTVFAASRRPRGNRLFQGIALLAVAIVLGIGAVAVFYARQQGDMHPLPSPLVAAGVERAPARELPVVPLESPPPDAENRAPPREPTAPAATPPPVDADPVAAAPPPARDPVPEQPAATTPAGTSPQTAAEHRAAAPVTDAAPATAPAPAAVAASTAMVPARPGPVRPAREAPSTSRVPATPPPARDEVSLLADVNAGEVRIARSRRAGGIEPVAAAAYAAYARGDLAAAAAGYRELLAREPDRRDALLGLAATALAAGDRESAFRRYAAVLERHPDDAVAAAALVSLTGGHGEATAARLRLLLDRHGELPYLHFALANWYARQDRWPDAQQAYFEAWRRDDDNPDYAFNLAVSLDRIGQAAAALAHYRSALTLADAHPARFDPAQALARIEALEGAAAEVTP
ncbi:MAG: hypothetical protein RKL32_02100 [Gammaproteobacteria bacterium]